MQSIRQYKKETFLASGFMVLEVICEVLVPFFMASLIDLGINKGDMNHITRVGVLLIILALSSMVFGVFSSTYASAAAAGFSANLRHDAFANIQSFSFANIDKFSSASLVTRLTTDVQNVMLAYQEIIRHAVRSVCMVSFALTLAFRINTKIATVLLIASPLLGLALFFIITKAHPFFQLAMKTYDKLNGIVQENLQGIRAVKAFVREDSEVHKFEGISSEIFTHFTSGQKRVAFNMPVIQMFTYICIILVCWFGATQISVDQMTTGDLMSMFAYVMQILMNMMLLSLVFIKIIIARASAYRLAEVINEKSTITTPANTTCGRVKTLPYKIMSVADGSIVFKDVDFSYASDGSNPCLMNVNLNIKAGETIGIIGGTGSSKSTLVQLIPRLYDVNIGTVSVGGVDVRKIDITVLREEVAMVLQKNTLFSGTLEENLRWGNPNATMAEMKHVCRLAQAEEFIESLPDGYQTHVEEGGMNFSGGQKQRLCIARALLKKPKVLILDDSTSAVDTKTDAMLRQAFRDEIPHITKLIIAQRISSLQDADRIVVMDKGRIDAIGTHDELLISNEIYREVCQSQLQGGGDFDE